MKKNRRSTRMASTPPLLQPKHDGMNLQAWGLAIVRLGLVATMVFAIFLPADSVQVEEGGALSQQAYAVIITAIALGIGGWNCQRISAMTLGVGVLLLWLCLSTWQLIGTGNVRSGIHELWVWISAFGLFASSRLSQPSSRERRIFVLWFVLCGFLLSAHAYWQTQVDFPELRAEYLADPEGTARKIGITDPEGTETHQVFMDRLFSTEPFASFSLPNSLAAVLLMAAVIIMALWFRGDFQNNSWPVKGLWLLCFVSILGALMLTKSRTASLAFILVMSGLVVVRRLRRRTNSPSPANGMAERLGVSLRTLYLISGVVAMLFMGFTWMFYRGGWDQRWITEAPMSVKFRLQYWKSTVSMIADHPWFGIGPGAYRNEYPLYRSANAAEVIADPHNWILEAATTGGVPCALMLIGLIIAWGWRQMHSTAWSQIHARNSPSNSPSNDVAIEFDALPQRETRSLPLWAYDVAMIVGVVSSVLWGWPQGLVLPWYPYVIMIPLVIVARYLMGSWINQGELPTLPIVAGVIALTINLFAAGGLTIPGILFPAVILMGIVVPTNAASMSREEGIAHLSHRVRISIAISVPVLLLGAFYFSTWRPVQHASRWLDVGGQQLQRGEMRGAEAAFESALRVDPYEPTAAMMLALTKASELMQNNRDESRKAMERESQRALALSPHDHALMRRVGDLWLEIYQRHGNGSDADLALQWYERAAERHPTDLGLSAQVAVLHAALKNTEAADRWNRRVWELEAANPWTDLNRAMILDPQVQPARESVPRRVRASERIANQS